MNPFERQTETLQNNDEQTKIISKIIHLLNQKLFHKVLPQLQNWKEQIAQDTQITFLQMLFYHLSGQKNQCETTLQSFNFQAIDDTLKLRIILFIISMYLNEGKIVKQSQIQAVIGLAKKNPKFKIQILLKLTGCSSLERMEEISSQEIQQLTQNEIKKAIKYQIVGNWKFFIQQMKECLKMKKLSLNIWHKEDKLKKYSQCKSQIEEIQQIASKRNFQSIYSRKLLAIQKICMKLKTIKYEQKGTAANRYVIRNILNSFQDQQMKLKQSKLSSSKMKMNENYLEERYNMGIQFHEQCLKNNYLYNQLLPRNKFDSYVGRTFIKNFGIFHKIVSKRYRQFWNIAFK